MNVELEPYRNLEHPLTGDDYMGAFFRVGLGADHAGALVLGEGVAEPSGWLDVLPRNEDTA